VLATTGPPGGRPIPQIPAPPTRVSAFRHHPGAFAGSVEVGDVEGEDLGGAGGGFTQQPLAVRRSGTCSRRSVSAATKEASSGRPPQSPAVALQAEGLYEKCLDSAHYPLPGTLPAPAKCGRSLWAISSWVVRNPMCGSSARAASPGIVR